MKENTMWHLGIRPYIIHEIDPEMVPIIDELNEHGQQTLYCCAGHRNQSHDGYVSFNYSPSNHKYIIKILEKHGLKNIISDVHTPRADIMPVFQSTMYYRFDKIGQPDTNERATRNVLKSRGLKVKKRLYVYDDDNNLYVVYKCARRPKTDVTTTQRTFVVPVQKDVNGKYVWSDIPNTI